MEKATYISVTQYCQCLDISAELLQSLEEYGFIDILIIEEKLYFPEAQLYDLEKVIRLHNELHINFEGIDTILHLMRRMEEMQATLNKMQNRLRLYEAGI